MNNDQNAQREEDSQGQENQNSSAYKRKSCLNFGKIFEIFPSMDTLVLCKLAELRERLPSKVRELVPDASAVQIAAFMNLVEEARQQQEKERQGCTFDFIL